METYTSYLETFAARRPGKALRNRGVVLYSAIPVSIVPPRGKGKNDECPTA